MSSKISMTKPSFIICKYEDVGPTDCFESVGGKAIRIGMLYKGTENILSEHFKATKIYENKDSFVKNEDPSISNYIKGNSAPLELEDGKIAMIDLNSLEARWGITASKINSIAFMKSVDISKALGDLLITKFLKKANLQKLTAEDGSKPYQDINMTEVPTDDLFTSLDPNMKFENLTNSTSLFIQNFSNVVENLNPLQAEDLILPPMENEHKEKKEETKNRLDVTNKYSLEMSHISLSHDDDRGEEKDILKTDEELGHGSSKTVYNGAILNPLNGPKSAAIIRYTCADQEEKIREKGFKDRFNNKPGFIPTIEDGKDLIQPKLFTISDFELTDKSSLNQLGILNERLGILIDAARGIETMHTENVVHKDIKLDNILFEVKEGKNIGYISDLGLASDLNSKDSYTQESSLKGTPGSTAPEQRNKHTYTASDIWSLGMTLYKAIYGKEKEYIPLQAAIDLYKQLKKNRDGVDFDDFIKNIPNYDSFWEITAKVEKHLYPKSTSSYSKDLQTVYNNTRHSIKYKNIKTKYLFDLDDLIFQSTQLDPKLRIDISNFINLLEAAKRELEKHINMP